MGNINNMRNVANSSRSMKSYVRNSIEEKQNKPYLKITGIKDLATLLGPNAKNHKINNNQRTFQLVGRTTIAGLAAALSIGSFAAFSNAHSNINENTVSTQSQEYQKDDVLEYAQETLKAIVYKDRANSMYRADVKFSHDNRLNTDTITIYEDIKSINGPMEQYSYTRYNNPEHKNSNKKNNTSPEIKELLDSMIDIHNSQAPSYEDLENLNDIVDNIASEMEAGKYTLVDGKIVENVQKDTGFELGD